MTNRFLLLKIGSQFNWKEMIPKVLALINSHNQNVPKNFYKKATSNKDKLINL